MANGNGDNNGSGYDTGYRLSYKAGWSPEHVTHGIYGSKEEARAAARTIPKKPKIFSIKVERVEKP